jgi:hypothetical protein
MAALNTAKLPEGEQWLYEVKWDGYRALALKQDGIARLLSRKGNDLTRDYPEVVEAIESIKAKAAVLDGEIVANDIECILTGPLRATVSGGAGQLRQPIRLPLARGRNGLDRSHGDQNYASNMRQNIC